MTNPPPGLHRATTTFFAATLTALLATTLSAPAPAVLTIEVNQGIQASIPIAIVPFGLDNAGPLIISDDLPAAIIEADLTRSGNFAPLPREDFLSHPQDLASVKYEDWRLLRTEALVIGQIAALGNHRYEIRFSLLDVFREKQLIGRKFVVPQDQLRKAAHQISDLIHEQLTGIPGAFDTRIAYINVTGDPPNQRYLLQIADADGHTPKTILESRHPLMSPAWSPDGNHLAYVSFEKKRSMVYIQNLWSGQRQQIAAHRGINSAPAWSPEGTRLALTLSKDGNPEIYIYDVASGDLQRLTRHSAIDTEPAWSPDGTLIVFTSGRSGTPQVYRLPASGDGTAQRLTFHGKYNANPSYASDGKRIVLITNQGNGYRVGVYSAEHRKVSELTLTNQDESPTFAPNDAMIMYATQAGGRSVLAAVSLDGRAQQVLEVPHGSAREPAWSPFNRPQ